MNLYSLVGIQRQILFNLFNTLILATWTFSWTTRVYWRCPINEAMTLKQLVDFINTN